jgi:hypothetical protein
LPQMRCRNPVHHAPGDLDVVAATKSSALSSRPRLQSFATHAFMDMAQRSATRTMKKTTTKTKATSKAAKTTTSKVTKATTKATGRAQSAHNAPKAAKVAKDATERKPSRRDAIVALISRANGATLPEIIAETGWQKHSVRGMISVLGQTMMIASSCSSVNATTR